MCLIYFDQNIWSALTRKMKNDQKSFSEFITLLKRKNNISVVYSEVNIKETLKRDFQDEIIMELSIISDITSNQLICENGSITETKPFELFTSILIGNNISSILLQSIESQIPRSDQTDPTLRKAQNNIDPRIAASQVFNRFFSQISISDSNVDFKQIDNIVNTLNSTISSLFIELGTKTGQPDNAEKYSNIVSSILNTSMEIGKQKTLEAMKTKNPDAIVNTILSVNNNPGWQTSVIQSMLGAFQYWPDTKKVLEKKDTLFDMDDSAHSKYAPFCTFFVSNDNHLRTRVTAAASYLKSNTQCLNYEQFLDFLRKEN